MSSMYNPLGIEIGDDVRIKNYVALTMSGISHTGYKSGIIGQVFRLDKDYDWRTEPNKAVIRYLTTGNREAWTTSHPLDSLDLIKKGDGVFETGVTQPFSEKELFDARLNEFDRKIRSTKVDWQGFSNAPTHLAHLYLSNDQKAMQELVLSRRIDGCINPNKVRAIFCANKMEIDDWAHEPVIYIPEEFKPYARRMGWENRVNWSEVAHNFKGPRVHSSRQKPRSNHESK